VSGLESDDLKTCGREDANRGSPKPYAADDELPLEISFGNDAYLSDDDLL